MNGFLLYSSMKGLEFWLIAESLGQKDSSPYKLYCMGVSENEESLVWASHEKDSRIVLYKRCLYPSLLRIHLVN